MNKRVKIVSTLGPAVEIRGGKKFVKAAIGENLLTSKHQQKTLQL